jgi:hypothetical protein
LNQAAHPSRAATWVKGIAKHGDEQRTGLTARLLRQVLKVLLDRVWHVDMC